VVAGNVGAEERYEYTVIGDPVNEAARLTEAAKDHDGHLLASGGSVARAGDEAGRWHRVGEVHLRGRAEPTALHAPRPQAPAVSTAPASPA
jgi:adenylate cyclase